MQTEAQKRAKIEASGSPRSSSRPFKTVHFGVGPKKRKASGGLETPILGWVAKNGRRRVASRRLETPFLGGELPSWTPPYMRGESLPPCPKGCGPPRERSRSDPWTVRDAKLVPTRFLIENFGDFCASDVGLRPFWVPKRVSGGSSGRVFRPFFPDAALHRFFVVFSVKNVQLEKNEKVRFDM